MRLPTEQRKTCRRRLSSRSIIHLWFILAIAAQLQHINYDFELIIINDDDNILDILVVVDSSNVLRNALG